MFDHEGENGMPEYRKIDSILTDRKLPIVTLSPMKQNTPIPAPTEFPVIDDEVSLDTDLRDPMMVEVTWVSNDQETLRGKVTHGYFPMEISKQIDVGTMVEFSRKKVGSIHKRG